MEVIEFLVSSSVAAQTIQELCQCMDLIIKFIRRLIAQELNNDAGAASGEARRIITTDIHHTAEQLHSAL